MVEEQVASTEETLMKLDEFIEELENQGHEWVAEEMRYYDDNPDVLENGDMIPNFDNVEEEMSLAMYYFYVGTVFGATMHNKHDIDT